MRIRRKAWARPELELCPFYVKDAPALIGGWAKRFGNNKPIYLELGCGKGRFVSPNAAANPQINYIAVDIKSEMLAFAKRNIEECFNKAGRQDIDNVLITSFDIARICLMLKESDRVDSIYINFPNPWPKEPHKKRRLTHTRQLLQYRVFLKEDGKIHFKTDDRPLFDDTLGYLDQAGFAVTELSTNLYENGVPNGTVLTEHEEMFIRDGKPINMLVARKTGLI